MSENSEKKTVLVMDDDPDILQILSIRLSRAGYRVVTAQDGVIGLGLARRERPSVILLDVCMPAGDGFTIAERINALPELAAIPVVFMTATRKPDWPSRMEELGAFAFLDKPFDPSEMLDIVQQAIEAQPVN